MSNHNNTPQWINVVIGGAILILIIEIVHLNRQNVANNARTAQILSEINSKIKRKEK